MNVWVSGNKWKYNCMVYIDPSKFTRAQRTTQQLFNKYLLEIPTVTLLVRLNPFIGLLSRTPTDGVFQSSLYELLPDRIRKMTEIHTGSDWLILLGRIWEGMSCVREWLVVQLFTKLSTTSRSVKGAVVNTRFCSRFAEGVTPKLNRFENFNLRGFWYPTTVLTCCLILLLFYLLLFGMREPLLMQVSLA